MADIDHNQVAIIKKIMGTKNMFQEYFCHPQIHKCQV